MTPVEVIRGSGPVILGQPHGGIFVPPEIKARLNANGRALADTDWHIGRLYDGLLPSASVVRATLHRYVIDTNRDPAGGSLYPGQNTTELCPVTDFNGAPIWQSGQEPTPGDIADRQDAFHTPYHAALTTEIERVKARHGIAILYDCHSIRSRIPFLFDGVLPLFSIGTDGGVTCAGSMTALAVEACAASTLGDHVVDGRFRGGWTTRHYGRPAEGVHAIQMELAQSGYLSTEAVPWAYDPDRAARLRDTLGTILHGLDRLGRSGDLSE